MTKRIHPAQTARTITGATAGLALVGIVTGFQFAAVAQENQAAATANKLPVDDIMEIPNVLGSH